MASGTGGKSKGKPKGMIAHKPRTADQEKKSAFRKTALAESREGGKSDIARGDGKEVQHDFTTAGARIGQSLKAKNPRAAIQELDREQTARLRTGTAGAVPHRGSDQKKPSVGKGTDRSAAVRKAWATRRQKGGK